VFVIDGKNSSNDGKFTNRVYMAIIASSSEETEEQAAKTQKNKVEKLRRNSATLHEEHKWAPGPR
jgi:hypothetical protein